jgi:sugar phosphate isomerase/epimerase
MIAPKVDGIGIESIEAMAAMGFDYIELSLAHMAALTEEEFDDLLARVARSGLRCEACNNFFPPHVRLTGPEADTEAALRYASLAMGRAAQLGVEIIVLGSSGAKNVPEGFPLADARGQFLGLLRGLAPLADENGITITVEPISRPEANFVILAAEGLALVRDVDHPRIRLLVDYFHMAGEGESPDVIREAGGTIHHAHFARPGDRVFPTRWEGRFDPFFQALGEIGYRGRLSIEAFTDDFEVDGPRALAQIRGAGSRYVP